MQNTAYNNDTILTTLQSPTSLSTFSNNTMPMKATLFLTVLAGLLICSPRAVAFSPADVSRKNFLQSIGGAAAAATLFPQSSKAAVEVGGKIRFGDEGIMSPKEHGTSAKPVQSDLLYGVSNKLADKICNYNRHFAEMGGYFQSTSFEDKVLEAKGSPLTFYDSVTGKPLFVAPKDRSPEEFIEESKIHGWPSFRDNEVVWENVRVLKNSGETVSVDGTHLGVSF